jgi:hypothetical protein
LRRDTDLLEAIELLAHQEHELLEAEGRDELDDSGRARLDALAVQLDRCWDLLRQRRARRSAGLDPKEARERDEATVEHYLQ